jgi:hypothetical protein
MRCSSREITATNVQVSLVLACESPGDCRPLAGFDNDVQLVGASAYTSRLALAGRKAMAQAYHLVPTIIRRVTPTRL